MLNLLELALNNNFIYISIILILIVIIVITILSIKKDRDEAIKARNKVLEKPTEEMKKAKLELETVVSEMQKKLDSREYKINKYEDEQEENAIISYQELIKSVNKDAEVHNEVGMDLADDNVIDTLNENYEEPIKETSLLEEVEPVKKETKFKNSEFISPIYGNKVPDIVDDKYVDSNKAFVMDDIIDEDFDEEDEFLDSLKDFRKNL